MICINGCELTSIFQVVHLSLFAATPSASFCTQLLHSNFLVLERKKEALIIFLVAISLS